MPSTAPPAELRPDQLWLPTAGRAIPRPWFLPSQEALNEQRRLLTAQYFLVRIAGNASIGEALVCDQKRGGCGAKHQYLTLRCVEQPFSGITGGLYAYYRAVKDNGLVESLSASERVRLDAIRRGMASFFPHGQLPDLGAHHPEMARRLSEGLETGDATLAGAALGVLEPIPASLARKYRDRIRTRGIRPRFDLPGMEG